MKSQRERDEEKKRQKLQDMQEQVRKGSLVVRQMTPEERERDRARPSSRKRT
jgi:hypothetical protein